MAQLMPLPLTVSCSSKIQIGFTFLVPAYPGCPGKEAVKWLLLLLFVIYFTSCIFNDFRQTKYRNIYRTDLRQIFRVGRTVDVDGQSEVRFQSLIGCCHDNQLLLVLATELSN